MSSPLFSHDPTADAGEGEPQQERGRGRRWGRGYDFTDEARERRLRRLEAIGRRCHGHSRDLKPIEDMGVCFSPSTVPNRKITVIEVDPTTKAPLPDAVEFTVIVCSRHERYWLETVKYKVIAHERMPALPPARPGQDPLDGLPPTT